ncbi:semaphorin-6B isoform X2 [Polypterus senegalus]|nr:semaphorin-6B isoform X2 [Polypterus senegalus]XP_039622920.1 semaphorin-6B isoform X2 [Polypterus senegalus]
MSGGKETIPAVSDGTPFSLTKRSPAAMTTLTLALLLLAVLLQLAEPAFPDEPAPLSVAPVNAVSEYAVFTGRAYASQSSPRNLQIVTMLKLKRTLLIGGRDSIYSLDLEHQPQDEMFYRKKITWEPTEENIKKCLQRGKRKEECRNFVKVLLSFDNGTLFACGTNAFSSTCIKLGADSLERIGDPISGTARCPQDVQYNSVAILADGSLYTATAIDVRGIDPVIYRSLKEGTPNLRTNKYESRWLQDPHFVHSLEWGEHVYFFFHEIAQEYLYLEKILISRVARVCKNDMGGSPRVLDGQWTSYLKATLNCSVPGDSNFYFNILQSMTNIVTINGREMVLGVFSTPSNSIPGSAVCAFDLQTLSATFDGTFKMQKSSDNYWTVVPDNDVPKPRPGTCIIPNTTYSSKNLPDDVLKFVREHPLMNDGVPSLGNYPAVVRTVLRYQFRKIAVDTEAGPYGNYTVLFLGSSSGIIFKFLFSPNLTPNMPSSTIFLEEFDSFNPEKCGENSSQFRRLEHLVLDKPSNSLLVTFPFCLIRVPVARCHLHTLCMKNCISTRDPYCGWTKTNTCTFLELGARYPFVQDVDYGDTSHLGSCERLQQENFVKDPDGMVSVNIVVASAVAAFVAGALLSGLSVCWFMRRQHQLRNAVNSGNSRFRGETTQSMITHSTGSVMSVTRPNGGYGGNDQAPPRSQSETLLSPLIMQNEWQKAMMGLTSSDVDTEGILPTPEQTPLQQKRRPPGLQLSGLDGTWEQTAVYFGSGPVACQGLSTSVMYLSSKNLPSAVSMGRGVRQSCVDRGSTCQLADRPYLALAMPEHRPMPSNHRNSSGDYPYPVTPKDSPNRRKVVSAPNTSLDLGDHICGNPESLRCNGSSSSSMRASSQHLHHCKSHSQSSQQTQQGSLGLLSSSLHQTSFHGLADFGSERTPTGQ